MLKLICHSFPQGGFMPQDFAMGALTEDGQVGQGGNLNPHLTWCGAPEGTKSFVLVCFDDDVPLRFEVLPGEKELSPMMPRRRFVHWLQANIPADVKEIKAGELSGQNKGLPGFGVTGLNDYVTLSDKTDYKVGDVGTGYDGCYPPPVDGRWHVYRFVLVALDTTLELTPLYKWDELVAKMEGHVLAADEWLGRYSLNARVRQEGGAC